MKTLVGSSSMLTPHSDSELEPLDEQFFVLLQDEELSQHDGGLIEANLRQPPAIRGSNACHLCDVLIPHGLSDEGSVLLGS